MAVEYQAKLTEQEIVPMHSTQTDKNSQPRGGSLMKALVVISFLLSLLVPLAGFAQSPEVPDADTTLSPYFLVTSDDAGTDVFPLKSTSAEVDIAGVIADVRVTQVYSNEGESTLEAIYVFPASTRAAVYGMAMTIGERTIVAEIKEREQARQDYEQAKQEGKSASLLEQQRPNVFQMNVANILPDDEIVVELSYTELLVPTDKTYEFVYPTVVGPRYSNLLAESAPQSEKWVANPYLKEGEAAPYAFDIKVNLSAGLPIQKIYSPTHETSVEYDGKWFASISQDGSEKSGGNRDFILKYQLAGGEIESGMLLYEGDDENFFLLMVQPPERVEDRHIPPREYIFIVDVSGSMRGYPLDISKKLLKDLIANLNPTDRLNVLLFAGTSAALSEDGSLPATEDSLEKAIDFIDRQRGGGGTEILPAMKRALDLPRTEGMSRTVVTVTDGYVRVEPEVFDLIRSSLGDANMFAFGIGTSVNRHIIEGMAHVGMGEPFVVTKQSEAPVLAEKFRTYIQTPVLTHVKLEFNGFETYDIEPSSIPDVLAERPVIVFGKWRNKARGTVKLNGFSGPNRFTRTFSVEDSNPMEANAALRYLWARHRIMILDDFNNLRQDKDRTQAITDLGLKYNLLTRYTSFVAIDSMVRADDSSYQTVKQPLPLPQGVSNTAVGSRGRGFAGASFYSMPMTAPTAVKRAMPVQSAAPKESLEFSGTDKLESETAGKSSDDERSQIGSRFAVEKVYSPDSDVSIQQFTREIEKHLPTLNICHVKGQVPQSLKLEIRIGKGGEIDSIKVDSQQASQGLKKCLIEQVRNWRFEELKNEKMITMVISLVERK